MELTATIHYPYDERIETLFIPESKVMQRASYTVKRAGDTILFSVRAQDATALRACLTTITKVLSVWEATTQHGLTREGNN